jgi:thioredoxin reductase (NADPH)
MVDRGNFVVTGAQCDNARGDPATALQTSVPGVFAVGDVRHGSVKRVAAAVGEGSSAVRSVYDHLASIGATGDAPL